MKSIHKRLILIVGLLFLISLACNTPKVSNLLPGKLTGDDPGDSPSDAVIPHNTDGAEVTFIPGATFQMGSDSADNLAEEDEFPQHQVTLNDFYIYTHEVSNQMYNVCVEAGYCIPPQVLESGPSSHYDDLEYADHPVVGVDWLMARDYCDWAGGRLPTEAEWELASRGPESLLYPWGEDEPACTNVNMGGCLVPPDTQPVGHYLLGNSPDKVWDMSGNVWEWTHDWYGDDYYSQSPEHNPIGPLESQDPDTPLRSIRGGGLNSGPEKMRSAYRMGLNPHRPFIDVGFRCVTGEGISLPAAYDHGAEYHERVPPDRADGGDSADDDDGTDRPRFWAESTHGPCPDPDGEFTLIFNAGASIPFDRVFAFLIDFPFDMDCDYDSVLGTVTCNGHLFAHYLDVPPPTVPISICFDYVGGRHCIEVLIWKPTDCGAPDESTDFEVDAFAGCVDTETTAIVAHFNPEDAPFGSTSTDILLLDCDPLPEEGYYMCRDLPGSPGDLVDVHFSTSDGRSDSATVTIPDCSVSMFIHPHCIQPDGASGPSLAVMFTGVDADLISLDANGTSLACTYLGGMVYNCSGLIGTAGESVSVTATFDTGGVLSGTTLFPDCDERGAGPLSTSTSCYELGGTRIPTATIAEGIPGDELDHATFNGTPLDCFPDPVFDITRCLLPPEQAGDPFDLGIFLTSGRSFTHDHVVPDCDGPLDFLPPWELVEVGCHSEAEYYAVIDTNLDVEFTSWRLEDVPLPKTCGEQPGRTGYWYCNFPINDWYTTLTFCAEWIGGPGEICETFPDAAFADLLPASCSTGDDPGDEDPCSVHDQAACEGPYANFCDWVGGECVTP